MTDHVLVTISFSHFCEKARWALDWHAIPYREEKYLPVFHLMGTTRAARRRSVPILMAGGQTIADSTDILHYADSQGQGPKLFPDGQEDEVARWEEEFDRVLGPAARRMAYHPMLADPSYSRSYMLDVSEGMQRRAMAMVFPVVKTMIQKSYGIDDTGIARSRERLLELFERVETTLADGRPYLAGDTFTAADLTFASLGAPLLFPSEHGFPLPPLDGAPEALLQLIDEMRNRTAGQFLLRLYKDHRNEAP